MGNRLKALIAGLFLAGMAYALQPQAQAPMTVTVPQNGNVVGITINQNDSNNNPNALTTNGNVLVGSLSCTGSPCGTGGGGGSSSLETLVNGVRIDSPTASVNQQSGLSIQVTGVNVGGSTATYTFNLSPGSTQYIDNQFFSNSRQSNAGVNVSSAYLTSANISSNTITPGTTDYSDGSGGGNWIFTSTGSLSAQNITANGTYGTNDATSGGLLLNCTGGGGYSGFCSQIYSNAGAQAALDSLLYLRAANSAWNEPLLYLSNASSNAQSTIRIDSGWPTFTMIDTSQSSGSAKKFQWSVHNGTLRLEGRNIPDNGFDSSIEVSSMAAYGDISFAQGYNPATNAQVQIITSTSNVYGLYVSTSPPGTAGSYYVAVTTSSEISVNGNVGTNGQVLTSQGVGLAPKWATSSGGGGASTLAVAIGSGTWSAQITSPTAAMSLDQSQFSQSLAVGSTAFLTISYATNTVTGNYTAASTDTWIEANCGSACTITIPSPTSLQGKVYMVQQLGSGNVTLSPVAGNISGSATALMNQQYSELDIISDGGNWQVK
jgi:hypothetical protein